MEGKRPRTIAGTSILMVMSAHKDYKDDFQKNLEMISDCVEIGRPTINDCYLAAEKFRDDLLPLHLVQNMNGA